MRKSRGQKTGRSAQTPPPEISGGRMSRELLECGRCPVFDDLETRYLSGLTNAVLGEQVFWYGVDLQIWPQPKKYL